MIGDRQIDLTEDGVFSKFELTSQLDVNVVDKFLTPSTKNDVSYAINGNEYSAIEVYSTNNEYIGTTSNQLTTISNRVLYYDWNIGYVSTTINESSIVMRYSSTSTQTYTSNIYYYDDLGNNILTMNYKNIDNKDVFGKPTKMHSKDSFLKISSCRNCDHPIINWKNSYYLCDRCKRIERIEDIPQLPWKQRKSRRQREPVEDEYSYMDNIPWVTEEEKSIREKEKLIIHKMSEKDSLLDRIPWLKNIKSYFAIGGRVDWVAIEESWNDRLEELGLLNELKKPKSNTNHLNTIFSRTNLDTYLSTTNISNNAIANFNRTGWELYEDTD